MDFLYLIYDKLVTYPFTIRPRHCKLHSPDGARAYCVPSRKYSTKSRFARVCELVRPTELNPVTLRECLCSEGPAGPVAASAEPAEPRALELLQPEVEILSDRQLEVLATGTIRGPGDWVTVEATIHNCGGTALSYATLEVEYLGLESEVLARNITVVGQLAAGETRKLRLSKKVGSFETYRVRVRNVRS